MKFNKSIMKQKLSPHFVNKQVSPVEVKCVCKLKANKLASMVHKMLMFTQLIRKVT